MERNVASQEVRLFAFDYSTGAPKTGLTNLTAYVAKGTGAPTQITASSGVMTEIDATNAPGWYKLGLTQGETDATDLLFTAKSATSNVACVGRAVTTTPPNYASLAVTSAGGVTLGDGVSHGGTLGSGTATLALSRISVVSQTSNTAALTVTGNGTGSGAVLTSGAGATGDGLQVTAGSTNGNGLVALGTGTGNGIKTTGGAGAGGDGVEAIAGGGVPIRGDITGNITGTLSTVTTLTNLPAITANWLTAAGTAADFGAEVADAILDRDMATGTDSSTTSGATGRTVRSALRVLRNKLSLVTGKSYKEDDSTTNFDFTVTTDGAAVPITVNDPA